MKILHVIGTYKPAWVYGGPIFSTSLLCENLAKAGHQVKMLTTTANGVSELDVPKGKLQIVDGVEVIYFHRYTKDHSHLSPGLFWQVWKDCRRYDAVHIHAWWNLPAIFAALICWLRGVKPVLSPRGMLSEFTFEKNHSSAKAIFHRTAGKFLLKNTRLHLTSEAEREECAGIGAASFVLPNFIQIANGHRVAELQFGGESHSAELEFGDTSTKPFRLLFLSRIHPKKNMENLFEALSRVRFDFCFQIAGMGEATYLDDLKKLAAEKGLAEKIEWLGELHGDEKFRRYAEADLFVLPSFNENFANVVIEALSAGTPVLVSEEVGLANYVKDNELGWICKTGAAEIAAALTAVFEKKNKRQEIRQKAPGIIERDFSPKALTEKYVLEYQRLKKNA